MSNRILVVEDDLGFREGLVDCLEDEDYEVVAASNVEEALTVAQSHSFSLLITDVRMPGPDGVDGFALLKKVQPELRCIIISGYSNKDASSKAISIEVEEWLAKPFETRHLLRAVERVLHSKSWAARYLELIQKAPVALVSACVSFFQRDKNAKLKDARDKAFLALHTAIRSDYVNARTANEFFSKLLVYDRDYRKFLSRPEENVKTKLLALYAGCFQDLANLAQTGTTSLSGGGVPASEFREFYNAVKDKLVTVDDFKLSTILRDIGSDELAKSPELYELHRRMWGVAS